MLSLDKTVGIGKPFIKPKTGSVNIYPNPASEKIIVEVLNAAEQKADLFNSNGIKIATCQLINNKTIVDVSRLMCGCYYISVRLKDIVENKKLAIAR